MFKITIQVRMGSAFSQIYPVENETPQGSVSSHILFNLIINDIFTKIDMGIGRSLYADDGALWKMQKIVDKCKKAIHLMRCLAGVEWGACRQSLKRVYGTLIRAAIDYGCMVYSSASKSQLLNVEAIQSQALRICCGAIRSSPITAVQVEMGEMPLEIRRLKLKMRYWINIKGHSDCHPIKKVLKNCWEYEYKNLSSFGWTANEEAQSMGLSDIKIAPSVATSAIPPWLFPMPVVDTQLYEGKHNKERSILTNRSAAIY